MLQTATTSRNEIKHTLEIIRLAIVRVGHFKAILAGRKFKQQSHATRELFRTNRAQVLHPLASGIPFFGRYLNMPSDPLPGDIYTPRAHSPRAGPSQRMAVSPGHEKDGILELPTGQSGHPLSPHYGDQYRAWLNGEPSPFRPGATVSTLTLTPQRP